jgi:ribosomal protein S24E
MSNAVIVKTRKFMRNPLLARKQVCYNVSGEIEENMIDSRLGQAVILGVE